ncbi:Kinase [Melia azedarach]|uniref:Kinase n=1 Tax=Melia azedarach TaxID=155640 RepID=A0ACC1XDC0_MELAZ|nr:Kinase [Melia azedarach]
MLDSATSSVLIFFGVLIFLRLYLSIHKCAQRTGVKCSSNLQGLNSRVFSIDRVLNEIEKPIQFSSQQLRIATDNFSHFVGAGGFGAVYKGNLSMGIIVAVKVFNGGSDKKIEDQFLAEVNSIGRINHINLVKLYRFCFDRDLRALVYEYIAVGTAKGIEYLHEDCQQRIIHYDIKPENILLDVKFCPKIADFGLAKLCNREKTHVTLTGGRGTPGYAAPELWMPFPVTHKSDVYSSGMLLFEILGRRRNMDVNLPEKEDKEKALRMAMAALWRVQYKPEARPAINVVVKMLEGGVEIHTPELRFQPQRILFQT